MASQWAPRDTPHLCRQRLWDSPQRPCANMGPILYHERRGWQRHWTFTGEKYRAKAPRCAPRAQQHQAGPKRYGFYHLSAQCVTLNFTQYGLKGTFSKFEAL